MESKRDFSTTEKIGMSLDDVITTSKNTNKGKEHTGRRERPARVDRQQQGDPKRIFVGNLHFDTTWRYLKDYMRKAGDVINVDIFEDASGRSKGCALVEFSNEGDARNALKQLNNTILDGREIFLREDRDETMPDKGEDDRFNRRERDGRGRGRGRGRERGGGRRFSRSRSQSQERGGSYEEKHFRGGRRSNGQEDQEDNSQSGEQEGYDPRTGGWQLIVQNLSWGVSWQDLKDEFREFGNVLQADVPRDRSGKSAGYGFVIYKFEEDAEEAIRKMDGAVYKEREISVSFCSGR